MSLSDRRCVGKPIHLLFWGYNENMITIESNKTEIDDALWKACSLFWRLFYSDNRGYGICYTCGARVHYKEANLGHYISRAYKAVKFHVDNLRYQCVQCNRWKNGEPVVFRENLVDEIGEKRVLKIEKLKDEPCPTKEWMLSELGKYKKGIKLIPTKALD